MTSQQFLSESQKTLCNFPKQSELWQSARKLQIWFPPDQLKMNYVAYELSNDTQMGLRCTKSADVSWWLLNPSNLSITISDLWLYDDGNSFVSVITPWSNNSRSIHLIFLAQLQHNVDAFYHPINLEVWICPYLQHKDYCNRQRHPKLQE